MSENDDNDLLNEVLSSVADSQANTRDLLSFRMECLRMADSDIERATKLWNWLVNPPPAKPSK